MLTVDAEHWYETIRMGDGVTLIQEPWIKPFYRCNIWHVRGRDGDLLFDSGLGHFSLRNHVPLVTERDLTCVASHAHFDHIGNHHEFPGCCIHHAEAHILADPRNDWTVADPYATDDMFDRQPAGWDQTKYHIKPATIGRVLTQGDVVDLGDRAFEVIHTPGHSPGGIALWEQKTGILLSGDVIYDGPLMDTIYHSSIDDYLTTLDKLRSLQVHVVHGGHFPSFGPVRFQQLINEYHAGKHAPGCHIASA
jgi:glyoxylase-like metal-dependent hydrolase (beta-lactamase superfamily II)